MRLSRERSGVRWSVMVCVWLCIAATLTLYTVAIGEHLSIVGELGRRGAAAVATPVSDPYLAPDVDGRVWIRHAQSLLEDGGLRVRRTSIDNAPAGRSVHWNSGWTWTLAAAGWLQHKATGEPIPTALARATLWLSPALLLLAIVVVSAFVARKAGAAAGAAIAVAMVGHNYFFKGFNPTYADHHGIVAALVLGMFASALFTGAGWWTERDDGSGLLPSSPDTARRAAIISGMCGAAGMWISAASVIPAIAIMGIAGAVAATAPRASLASRGAQFDARVWRLWGRTGAAASVCFYLLEYFPFDLALRLEVNHPFYALAWLGAGELIATLTARTPRTRASALLPAALLIPAPLTILLLGADALAPLDPFLATLHARYITEFESALPSLSNFGVENLPLVAGLAVLAVRRGNAPPVVWWLVLATLGCTALGWWQNRWLDVASGPQICLALVLVVFLSAKLSGARRWAATAAVFGGMFLPTTIGGVVTAWSDVRNRQVGALPATLMLYRDVAAVVRASQQSDEIVLLTTPHASPHVAYFGRFRTVGSFYWENAAGLRAEAEILSARDENDAARLIREHGVTHIAVWSHDDFFSAYRTLLHPGNGALDTAATFGRTLLDGAVPQWLMAIPYRVPRDLAVLDTRVRLFKVAFGQSVFESRFHAARAKLALGDGEAAERDADAMIARDSTAHLGWLLKSEVLFTKRQLRAATNAAIAAIIRAPAADRVRIAASISSGFISSGNALAAQGRYGEAVALTEQAIEVSLSAGDSAGARQANRLRSHHGRPP